MSLLDLPWDDPIWRAHRAKEMDAWMRECTTLDLETIAIHRTYDRARQSVSRKRVTPCCGYWQNPSDRHRESTVEDEEGL